MRLSSGSIPTVALTSGDPTEPVNPSRLTEAGSKPVPRDHVEYQ